MEAKNKDNRKLNINDRNYLGEILMSLGYISHDKLSEVIKDYESLHAEFCEYLVSKGYISSKDLEQALDYKVKNNTDLPTALISLGLMTKSVFYGFFKNYSIGHKKLGEKLVENKLITKEQLEEALEIQKIDL